jgi:hypothetical protein
VIETMQNILSLRNASPEDEAFVLGVEEASLRKLEALGLGRYVPRPGLGDEFPTKYRVIRYGTRDVGCLLIDEEEETTRIDQLYLVPFKQDFPVVSLIAARFVDAGLRHNLRVSATVLNDPELFGVFEAAGFRRVSVTSQTMTLEYQSQPKQNVGK